MKSTKAARTIALLILGFGLAVNGHAQSFLTNGLVAYYPFNGNANDASGNGFNGTVFGATLTTNRFGNPNAAYYFNGTSAYITVPVTSTVFSNDFTASVWFNAYDIANGWPAILFEHNESFLIQIAGDFCGCASPGYLISYSAYAPATFGWFLDFRQQTPTNTYCQVVVTKAGTNVTMYLNSQVVVTGYVSNPTTQPGQYLQIGRVDNEDVPGDSAFHGVIDDVRIYNRALSSKEVTRLYAIESIPIVSVRKAVYLDSCNLWVGTNYQVQVSSDLINWTNFGAVFTATNFYWRSTNYWDVANWNQLFFRLEIAP